MPLPGLHTQDLAHRRCRGDFTALHSVVLTTKIEGDYHQHQLELLAQGHRTSANSRATRCPASSSHQTAARAEAYRTHGQARQR